MIVLVENGDGLRIVIGDGVQQIFLRVQAFLQLIDARLITEREAVIFQPLGRRDREEQEQHQRNDDQADQVEQFFPVQHMRLSAVWNHCQKP